MNKFYKNFLLVSLLILVFNIIPQIASAQIDPGEDPDAPIDGGISLLVGAGIAYGVKKARDYKKIERNKFQNEE